MIIRTRLILPDVPEGTDPLDIETAKIPRIEKPEIHPMDKHGNEKSSYHASFPRSGDFAQDDNSVHAVFEEDGDRAKPPLSADHLNEHNKQHATSPLEYIIVRMEVTDTGYGIKREDMAGAKLFCKYFCLHTVNRKISESRFQLLLTKLSAVVSKEEKVLVLGSLWFAKLSS